RTEHGWLYVHCVANREAAGCGIQDRSDHKRPSYHVRSVRPGPPKHGRRYGKQRSSAVSGATAVGRNLSQPSQPCSKLEVDAQLSTNKRVCLWIKPIHFQL